MKPNQSYTVMQIPLPPDTLEALFVACQKSGLSLDEWITEAVLDKAERELAKAIQPELPVSWRLAWARHGRSLGIGLMALNLGWTPLQRIPLPKPEGPVWKLTAQSP